MYMPGGRLDDMSAPCDEETSNSGLNPFHYPCRYQRRKGYQTGRVAGEIQANDPAVQVSN